MTDELGKKELENILAVLGNEGIIDTLLCVRELDWATASEVAEHMDTHVATAVKRLTGLYEIGILDRRVRRGKTRSAQEYSLRSSSFGLDIDLDELTGHGTSAPVEAYLLLFRDMARRFGKFSGRSAADIEKAWNIKGLEKAGASEIVRAMEITLDNEAEEYGELTVRSLAAASLDAIGRELEGLPEKYFGVR